MSASYCFVLHGRCIAPRVRDSIFAEHQRPQVAAFMECVDFMQPRWPSRISIFNSIFCRSFRFGTEKSAEIIAQQKKLFREKFGREPGPDDPLFFDPKRRRSPIS